MEKYDLDGNKVTDKKFLDKCFCESPVPNLDSKNSTCLNCKKSLFDRTNKTDIDRYYGPLTDKAISSEEDLKKELSEPTLTASEIGPEDEVRLDGPGPIIVQEEEKATPFPLKPTIGHIATSVDVSSQEVRAKEFFEKDPTGRSAHDPGAKLDEGKPMAGLLLDFGDALIEVAKVSTHGAKKYSRGGWMKVPDAKNRYTDALMRHLLDEKKRLVDKDSGLLVAAHAAWNALARLHFIIRERDRLAAEPEFEDGLEFEGWEERSGQEIDRTKREKLEVELVELGPDRFCGDCKNLNLTEEEQDRYREEGIIQSLTPAHRCKLYQLILFHNGHVPHIFRDEECLKNGGYESRDAGMCFEDLQERN